MWTVSDCLVFFWQKMFFLNIATSRAFAQCQHGQQFHKEKTEYTEN
jgi:hypothetical protein